MASLYRPKIITYRLRDGSYRTPDGKRVKKDTFVTAPRFSPSTPSA
jgi:hypothetical protein